MNTQNVNVAAPESTERCSRVKRYNVIAEQQSLLLRLAGIWNLQLAENVLSLYKLKGARAVEYACSELADFLAHEKYYRDRENAAA